MTKALLVKPYPSVEVIEFEDSLEFYYKNIECNLIDIVRPYALLKESKKCKHLILIVDDEGLLVANPKVNPFATLAYGQTICGNVIVAKEEYTEDGIITIGLNEDDVNAFNEALIKVIDKLK